MRTLRKFVPVALGMALVMMPLLLSVPQAKAVGPDTSQSIHDGHVVAITGTTIEVKEWAGTYTYRLSPTGLEALQAAQIRPGDDVRFAAYTTWQIAYDIWKR